MRTVRAASMLAILAILIGCSRRDTQAVYRPPGEHKLAFSSTITKTVDLKYHLYLPDGYGEEQDESWPLILFLHGSGERGDDLELVDLAFDEWQETRHDKHSVVAEPKFVSSKEFDFRLQPGSPGLKHIWQPHLQYRPHLRRGTARRSTARKKTAKRKVKKKKR